MKGLWNWINGKSTNDEVLDEIKRDWEIIKVESDEI